MRFSKNLLLAAFTFVSLASTNASSDPTTSSVSEISSILQTTFSTIDVEDKAKLFVTFMLNDANEIIVLSTNTKKYDRVIKTSLNYKAIDATDLKKGEKYTLPISLEK